MKEKVLITGAGGLLAKNLGKVLIHSGYNVCYLSSNKKIFAPTSIIGILKKIILTKRPYKM